MASATREPAASSRMPGWATAPCTSTTIVVATALLTAAWDGAAASLEPVNRVPAPSRLGASAGGARSIHAAAAASTSAPAPPAIVMRSDRDIGHLREEASDRDSLRPKPGARALDAGPRKQGRRLRDACLSGRYRPVTEVSRVG